MRVGSAFGFTMLEVVLVILDFIQWTIFVWVILSWVLFFTAQSSFQWRHRGAFNILFQLNDFFTRLTNPILRPFRRLLPPYKTGGVDWSPLLLLLAIFFIRRFLVRAFSPLY